MIAYPRMTYYSRLLDNASGDQLLGWTSTADNHQLYYGRCNALKGGESEYIVELDIWNNEPAWDGGTPHIRAQDALDCKLKITIPPETRNLNPFLYARCITYDAKSEFKPVDLAHQTFSDIQGCTSQTFGSIAGSTSDHATIQTKIKLKPHSMVNQHQYPFTLSFTYNFE